MASIDETIIAILTEIRPEVNGASSENLIEDGLLDSLDIVTLVSALDDKYSISIDGMDVVPENFKNVRAISSLLHKYGVRH